MRSTSYEKIYRRYIFNQKELKEVLGIRGIISHIGLERGLSHEEEEEGKSTETNSWYFETEEKRVKDE